jgi:predicted RNase H-like HicB family nuclease
MTVYDAYAERSDGWWAVEVADVGGRSVFTQGRTLLEAEAMAADAIASVLQVKAHTIDVNLHVRTAFQVLNDVASARQAREEASVSEQATLARAARALVSQGMSQRDAAKLLHISHQRVSQLLHEPAMA